jgi:hypothetical protein
MSAMIKSGRFILIFLAALIVCLGLGFAWGASGRGGLQTALNEAQQQLDVAEARGQILDARVSLYTNNFGDASRHFEDAKAALRRVKSRYQDAGRSDAASRVDAALGHVEEGQRLAGKLDSSANAKAGDALDALKLASAKQ